MNEKIRNHAQRVIRSVSNVFVGDTAVIEKLMAAALANGHVLFEDYPGLGKTLLVKVFARTIGADFDRVQFTPDILPADIVGSRVWNPADGEFRLERGPVFTNVLLADEINRSPPKTQSALLEAMEERQVTIEGQTMQLEPPFFVLATQNPIEQEGTYPLPEAQMDRFLLRLSTGYPRDLADEREIMKRRIAWHKDDPSRDVQPVMTRDAFLKLQGLVENRIFIHDAILDYIATIVRRVRDHPAVEVGPSPRGDLALLRVARATALLQGRDFVTPDDVKTVAVDGLAHRIILEMEHVLEGTRSEDVVQGVLDDVPAPAAYARNGGDGGNSDASRSRGGGGT